MVTAIFAVSLPFCQLSNAQCYGPSGGVQVCNPDLSSGTVRGDGSQIIYGSATIEIPAGFSGGGATFYLGGTVGASWRAEFA